MGIILRPYQLAAIEAAKRAFLQGRKRVIVSLPTGAGKTITIMHLIRDVLSKGNRTLFLAHRDELLEQPRRAAVALGIDETKIGTVKADRNEIGAPLVLASVQTLAREARRARCLPGAPPFRVCVYDECHHSFSDSGRAILDALPRECFVVGLTATVERADGASLSDVFPGGICYSLSLLEAIRDGWLVDFRSVRVDVPGLKLDDLAVGADGDFADDALAERMAEDAVIQTTVAARAGNCTGRRALVFTASVLQAQKTADAMNAAGARALAVDGTTPISERRRAVADLAAGRLDALCNCALFLEGTDIPECDAIVVARPTLSKPLYVQICGRGLRTSPNKADCLIVDLVGASALHTPYTAPVLVGLLDPPPDGEPCGRTALGPDRKIAKRAWDVSSRRREWAHWCDVGTGVMAASGPDRTMVIVRPAGDGAWLADFWRNGTRENLTPSPVWRELAVGLAEDVVRRLEGAKKLVKAGASWRDGEPTEKQLTALTKWRIAERPKTKGEAADLMTVAAARAALKRTP